MFTVLVHLISNTKLEVWGTITVFDISEKFYPEKSQVLSIMLSSGGEAVWESTWSPATSKMTVFVWPSSY